MPVPKSKKPANGAANGTAVPVAPAAPESKDTSSEVPTTTGGRPDKKAYDAEQDKIRAGIDALQVKLNAVREKIGQATSKSGPGNEKRNALKAELDSIRNQQSSGKNSRGKLLEQKAALVESVEAKKKALKAAKSKIPFKSVAEVEAHIENAEKQVESGNLKLAEEKRTLQDISNSKRFIRQLEAFQADEAAIEAENQKIAELKKELDDPEAKKLSERYDTIKAELDALKKESDEAYASRSKLFDERDGLQAQLNELYDQKRKLAQNYKDANDRFYTKLAEDRQRRHERIKAQREAEWSAKKRADYEQKREDAKIPAFQAEIEDCQTLIDYFSGKTDNVTYKTAPAPTALYDRPEVQGVPKLEIRKVEELPGDFVALKKKKGDDEENYFVASKKGKKKQGGAAKAETPAPAAAPSTPASPSGALNITLATLTALGTLSIPAPESQADVPRLIKDLTTKMEWYKANQERVTKENQERVEEQIRRLDEAEAAAAGGTSGTRTPIDTGATSSEAADEKVEVEA